MPRVSIALALLCVISACGPNPETELEAARSYLEGGDYASAAEAASRGLAAGAEGATAWKLELAALEGEARDGDTDAVLARLERLAGAWSEQVGGSLYVQAAGQLKEAGDASGAIGVLDAGAKRFPDDAAIAKAIEQAKTSGSNEELERLRSLGYVE